MSERNLIMVPCVALLVSAASVQAQQLEEITVTAQRFEQTLQTTPVSVAAFDSDRIRDLDVLDPRAIADFVPNLSIGDGTGRGSGGSMISIRGVNEGRISPVLDPAVGIYIDDVYYGRPQTAFLKLLDVDRVEVLRGPQGTLFGKNSTGGAIRYITTKPNFDGTSGYAQVTVGNLNRADFKAGLNITLSDTWAARFTAATLNRDGYVTQLAGGPALGDEDTKFLRGQLRWEPSERISANLALDYTKRDTDDGATKVIDYWRYNNNQDIFSGGPTNASGGASASGAWNGYWGRTPVAYNPGIPDSLYEVSGLGRPTVNEAESFGATLDINFEVNENFTVRSITGYRDVDEYTQRDPDGQASAYTFFDDTVTEGVDFFSQEFQLNGLSFDNRLNWVAGVYYSKEEPFRIDIEDRDARNPQGRRGIRINNDNGQQTTKSLGLYAQGTFDVTEKLGVTLGGRYSEDDKSYTVSQVVVWDSALAAQAASFGLSPVAPVNINGCNPAQQAFCVSNPGLTGGDTFDSFTPRVALQYQLNDDFMAYGSASKGFKSGGTNDTTGDINTPFEPEELWSYELGLRSEFMDRRLRLNVTYFSMDYEDKQLTVTTSPVCNNRCTTNVGSAKIDGWEIESVWQATEALRLHANIGILDANWDEITNPSAGVTGASNFARAPDSSLNLGGRYDWTVNNGGVVFMLDYSYRDDQESSGQDSTTLTIPSYGLWTARIKYVSNEGDWEVGVFCTNCADEEYITGGAAWGGATDNTQFTYKESTVHPAYVSGGLNPWFSAAPGITMVNVGAPRMYGVDLRYNF